MGKTKFPKPSKKKKTVTNNNIKAIILVLLTSVAMTVVLPMAQLSKSSSSNPSDSYLEDDIASVFDIGKNIELKKFSTSEMPSNKLISECFLSKGEDRSKMFFDVEEHSSSRDMSYFKEEARPQGIKNGDAIKNITYPVNNVKHFEATKQERLFITSARIRAHVIKEVIISLDMGLEYDRYLHVVFMSKLKSEYSQLREEAITLGHSSEADMLMEDLGEVSQGFSNLMATMENMCELGQNNDIFCALFAADMYLSQASEFKELFSSVMKKLGFDPVQAINMNPFLADTYKTNAQKFEVFKLLETSRWSSGDQEGALSEFKATSEAYEKVREILSKHNLV